MAIGPDRGQAACRPGLGASGGDSHRSTSDFTGQALGQVEQSTAPSLCPAALLSPSMNWSRPRRAPGWGEVAGQGTQAPRSPGAAAAAAVTRPAGRPGGNPLALPAP